MRFFEILDSVLSYHPEADAALLQRAYVFAGKAHGGKPRRPGEPYLSHELGVAEILAGMHLDEQTIAAGLLHDLEEMGRASAKDIEAAFGPGVARIVSGVTKLTQLDFPRGAEGAQAEYIRKMILAMSQDIRVVLVELADRLHDLRTLECRDAEEGAFAAREALDIYAPLAARLGIEWMKEEIEDFSFRCLHPEESAQIVQGLARTKEERRRYIEEMKELLSRMLAERGLAGKILGRSKHIYSIWQKMVRQQRDLGGIYDLTAFRVILDTVKACYEALSIVHEIWEPVPGRFKDFIAKPKPNMYQSIHTTVIGPRGQPMEIQIRTGEMDRIAKEGIAAHWLYKEGKPTAEAAEAETRRFSWLRQLLDWHKDLGEGREVLAGLDLYPDEVYVFTPQGQVKVLAKGATPVDFAYEVHSEVGHRCVGARVNGKIAPLRSELKNGDVVEILTAAKHQPSQDWLSFVKTSKARNRIRQWMKTEERERSLALGREMLEREFRRRSLALSTYLNSGALQEVAAGLSFQGVEDLIAAVGFHKVTPNQVLGRLFPAEPPEPSEADLLPVEKPRLHKTHGGIRVTGLDDIMLAMARCCNPIPGEPIVGYITRGRGITVHRAGCKSLDRGDAERRIDVQWDTGEKLMYPVDVQVTYAAGKGTLGAVSALLSQLDVVVSDVKFHPREDGLTLAHMRIEVKDSEHLRRVLGALRGEKNVVKVQRTSD